MEKDVKFKESETIELKRTTGELEEALKSISAILNKHGKGELFFGLRENGEVIGQMISEKTLRDISKAISDKIEPKIYPKISEKNIDGKNCILVEFEGNNSPYFANGRAYMRVSDEDKQLSAKKLEEMYREKREIYWDSQICKKATINDLNKNSINYFLKLVKTSKRIDIKNENIQLFLKKLNLINDNEITNAAVLLFCKNPARFFSNTSVRCGRFKGFLKEEIIDMKDFDSGLFENLDNIMKFLKEHLFLRARIEGVIRKENWEIPLEALREAIINALIHRDYFEESYGYIKVYDSEIIIANPGGLLKGMTIKELFKEHESILRNPLLARCFYYSGLIDAWGRGILNIIRILKSEKLKKPIIEADNHHFKFIFKRSEPVNEPVNEPVSPLKRKQIIIKYIKNNKKAKRNDIVKNLGIPLGTLKRDLSILIKEKKINKIGSDKIGYYELN